MMDQTQTNTLVMNKKRPGSIYRLLLLLIIIILPAPYLHNTFCTENVSPVLTPICLYCCVSQNKHPPNLPSPRTETQKGVLLSH